METSDTTAWRNRHQIAIGALVGCIAGAIAASVVTLLLVRPHHPLDVYPCELYGDVVRWVHTGAARPDGEGKALLPRRLQRASIDGSIYIGGKDRTAKILFKTWIGKGDNVRGLMFTSEALTRQDLGVNAYGKPTIAIGPRPLEVECPIDMHWYVVSYRLD